MPELKALGKCVLVISHDDRYFHSADRIVRMESGQIVSVDERIYLEPSGEVAVIPKQ